MDEQTNTHYIGDGVYVEVTAFDYILKTNRGREDHYIHIDPTMLRELIAIAKTHGFEV